MYWWRLIHENNSFPTMYDIEVKTDYFVKQLYKVYEKEAKYFLLKKFSILYVWTYILTLHSIKGLRRLVDCCTILCGQQKLWHGQ